MFDCVLCISTIEDFSEYEAKKIINNLLFQATKRLIMTMDCPPFIVNWAEEILGIKTNITYENALTGITSTYPQEEFKNTHILLIDIIK